MPLLTFNLVKIRPNIPDGLDALHSSNYDTKTISSLRKNGLLVSGISSDYDNERKGIYVVPIAGTIKDLEITAQGIVGGIKFETAKINPSSYLIKFILHDLLANKVKRLAEEGKVYLPSRWNQYGELQFCFPEVINRSVPHGLFALRKCVYVRVEHLDNELYIQLDARYRRFSNLKLDKIIDIIKSKGFPPAAVLKNLKCNVVLEDNRRAQGYIVDASDPVAMTIRTENGNIKANPNVISLNATFFDVRDFIINTLGENLVDIENTVRKDIKIPSDTMRSIQGSLQQVRQLLFPVFMGTVEYDLDNNMKQLEVPSADNQGVLF